ncbi:AraC family transcriptional regulator [Roseibacillus ishigakijimensis]|uniref:AraC family transcriptional regulator n=1 Tax=Roseibacillus ishigakijimensis TaxID=454146 RepID=A0A934VGR2_9BACT|nr:AraC family transcriptional regulator [Roseibacillus ishigakijimensis]
MVHPDDIQGEFLANLAQPLWGSEIFDEVSDTVAFVKDAAGRYLAVNETLVRRCGARGKADLIGKTAQEVFPSPLGEDFTRQDLELLAGGPTIRSQLELHLYPGGESGWCLTWKRALFGKGGEIVGLTGISRDLTSTSDEAEELGELAQVLRHIRDHLEEPLTLEELSLASGLSPFQIGQRIKRIFGLTTRQYITRARIEAARHLLKSTSLPLSEIALQCGFSDQSALTRQFKRAVGITPKIYRDQ